MPDDVDKWAERVAIAYANYRARRRTAEGLRVLEEQTWIALPKPERRRSAPNC